MADIPRQRAGPATARDPEPPIPPALRGWFHLVCFCLSVPAGMVAIAMAPSARARLAAAVYAFGLSAMFGVSAAYHRLRWSHDARRRMRRTDHATIFVMIAGSYTPLCLLALHGTLGTGILVGVWIGAVTGVGLALSGIAERAVIGLACYILLGWVAAAAVPQLAQRLSGAQIGLLFVGGIVYTAGGVILGLKRPNPYPLVFGYHEVWHAMVAAACACHYIVILGVIRAGP